MALRLSRRRFGGLAVALALFVSPVAAHADSTAGVFVPTQGRVVDTRSGLGGYSTPLPVGTTRTFQVTGLAGVPTTGVTAVSVTLTAVNEAGSGYLSASASGAGTPTGTALNYNSNYTVSNTAMLAVGSDGKIAVTAQGASTNLLIDVQGYFKPGDSTQTGGFTPLNSFEAADATHGSHSVRNPGRSSGPHSSARDSCVRHST